MQLLFGHQNNHDSQAPKGKLARLRHLQTLLVQVVIVVLLLYLLYNNGSLNKNINQRLSHQFMTDVFSDYFQHLVSEIKKTRALLEAGQRKSALEAQEIKKMVRLLAKEIGLPLLQKQEKIEEDVLKGVISQFLNQQQQNQPKEIEDSEQNQTVFEEDLENESQQDSFEEEAFESEQNELFRFEVSTPQQPKHDSSQKDNFHSTPSMKNDQKMTRPKRPSRQRRSQVKANKPAEKTLNEESSQLKRIFLVLGQIFLLAAVVLCLSLMVSFIRNPKNRTKPTETFEEILKMGEKPMNPKSLRMTQKELLKF